MRISRPRRQILLFLAAVLMPAGALIWLAGQIVYQDRELAAKRVVDQRHAAVEQVRREVSSRLETIKLREINGLIRPLDSRGARGPADPAVIFTATLENDRLILPWEPATTPDDPSAEFARYRQAGEAQEFIQKNYTAAAAYYRLALANARRVHEGFEARLALARTLFEAGQTEEALSQFRALTNAPAEARDDQGVGFRFYAAERLMAAAPQGHDAAAIRSLLRNQIAAEVFLTLPELYMVRGILRSSADERTSHEISERIAAAEQAEGLARDFVRVRAEMETGASADSSVWVPYGEEPWLVTMATPQSPLPGLVIAVSSATVVPPGVRLVGRSAEGDYLGEAFPGLRVEWTDGRFRDAGGQGPPVEIWIAAVALVLGIAVFGGYLLLRDVNRDMRMNEVRSQFVASVSHELKTPLTAIRMYAETLAMGRTRDEKAKCEYLETIVNESERLARLVDNVLDFSKIEQGKKIYRHRPIRLEEVAGSAARAMHFPLSQQGFELRLWIQDKCRRPKPIRTPSSRLF